MTKRHWLFHIISWLPAASTIVADVYTQPILLRHGPAQDVVSLWRGWLILLAMAAGVAVPRLWVRLICTLMLLLFVFLGGFGIGLFYIPTLGLATLATIVQLDRQK